MGGGSGDRQESLWRFLLLALPHVQHSCSYCCTQLGQASPPHTADRMMYRITCRETGMPRALRDLQHPQHTPGNPR